MHPYRGDPYQCCRFEGRGQVRLHHKVSAGVSYGCFEAHLKGHQVKNWPGNHFNVQDSKYKTFSFKSPHSCCVCCIDGNGNTWVTHNVCSSGHVMDGAIHHHSTLLT